MSQCNTSRNKWSCIGIKKCLLVENALNIWLALLFTHSQIYKSQMLFNNSLTIGWARCFQLFQAAQACLRNHYGWVRNRKSAILTKFKTFYFGFLNNSLMEANWGSLIEVGWFCNNIWGRLFAAASLGKLCWDKFMAEPYGGGLLSR
jgi:hypothetical protein